MDQSAQKKMSHLLTAEAASYLCDYNKYQIRTTSSTKNYYKVTQLCKNYLL